MKMKMNKILGVLGGMGPAATAEFLRILARDTPAHCDQEHPRVLMFSDPSIPDRSNAILGEGDSPEPYLRKGLEKLVSWGADLLAIPCNTAHHFIDGFKHELTVPLIHIVEETVSAAKRGSPKGAWLLSTSGTRRSGLYPACAERLDYTFRDPGEKRQERIQQSLTLVKEGRGEEAGRNLRSVVEELWAEEDLLVVTACTELPLAYAVSGLPPEKEISSLQALVNACVVRLYWE